MRSLDDYKFLGIELKWFLLAAILFLVIIRFLYLDIDPPYFFAGITQAHLTDPYHLTFHARNAVLFGDWTPFDYHRWDVFKNSLVSGSAFLLFKTFGVSRVTANLSGLVLNLLGILFVFMGLRVFRSMFESLLAVFLALLSAVLMFYGRMPFLENGLIFWSGLIFYWFIKYYDRKWAYVLIGFLVALAAFSGKLFGFILMGPIAVSLFYVFRKNSVVPILLTIAGSVAGTAIYNLIFYGGSFDIMFSYYREQTVGMYGAPIGFLSVMDFISNLFTYGGESGFFRLSPFMILLGAAGSIVFISRLYDLKEFDKKNLPIVYAATWLLTGIFLLAPFTYRPLRYSIFLFLPLTVMSSWAICQCRELKDKYNKKWLVVIMFLIFIIAAYLTMHIRMYFVPGSEALITGQNFIFQALLIAIAITGIIFLILYIFSSTIRKLTLLGLLGLLFFGVVINQSKLIHEGLALPGPHLKELNKEVAQMVDGDAVLTGPYTPALTIDNNLKGIIYVFGLADIEYGLYEKFPITHNVVDYSNWQGSLKLFPMLKESLSLHRFRVRDGAVELFRIPDADISMTDFERVAHDLNIQKYDSVLYYNEQFCSAYPDNLAGQFNLIILYLSFGQIERAIAGLDDMARTHSENFRVMAFAYQCYALLYRQLKDEKYNGLAEEYFAKTKLLNPSIKRVK